MASNRLSQHAFSSQNNNTNNPFINQFGEAFYMQQNGSSSGDLNHGPALDLRTAPTTCKPSTSSVPSPVISPIEGISSTDDSGKRSSPASSSSASSSPPYYKKIKLDLYKKQIEQLRQTRHIDPLSSDADEESCDENNKDNCDQVNNSHTTTQPNQSSATDQASVSIKVKVEQHANNKDKDKKPGEKNLTDAEQKKVNNANNNSANGVRNHRSGGKKYKGEFDEPTPDDVKQRERALCKPACYHSNAIDKGQCACVIGSEFHGKSGKDVLVMVDDWRKLNIEERNKWKWDALDLPKDIPLSDIKKFEDLRREYSDGKADFGGTSKRKPLGIRGTRQFLMILYCLWGHPGHDDLMQREGYCPHCFAKIKKQNEQSTLVRVVNHFNMKHRRGTNPRLSPQHT